MQSIVQTTVLFTTTVLDAEVVLLPDASKAVAVSIYVPFGINVVFQEALYGLEVLVAIGVVTVPLLYLKITLAIPLPPVLSDAVAERASVPDAGVVG